MGRVRLSTPIDLNDLLPISNKPRKHLLSKNELSQETHILLSKILMIATFIFMVIGIALLFFRPDIGAAFITLGVITASGGIAALVKARILSI